MNNKALFLSISLLFSGTSLMAMAPQTPVKMLSAATPKAHLLAEQQLLIDEMKGLCQASTPAANYTQLIARALELKERASDWAGELDDADNLKLKKNREPEVLNQAKKMYLCLTQGLLMSVVQLRARVSMALTRAKRQQAREDADSASNNYAALVSNGRNLGVENFDAILHRIQLAINEINQVIG